MENSAKIKQIEEDKELYESHYVEKIEAENLTVYVNTEKTPNGDIISAYIGLEDENGMAITGYDMDVDFKN